LTNGIGDQALFQFSGNIEALIRMGINRKKGTIMSLATIVDLWVHIASYTDIDSWIDLKQNTT
jgi:hypothetical protein